MVVCFCSLSKFIVDDDEPLSDVDDEEEVVAVGENFTPMPGPIDADGFQTPGPVKTRRRPLGDWQDGNGDDPPWVAG